MKRLLNAASWAALISGFGVCFVYLLASLFPMRNNEVEEFLLEHGALLGLTLVVVSAVADALAHRLETTRVPYRDAVISLSVGASGLAVGLFVLILPDTSNMQTDASVVVGLSILALILGFCFMAKEEQTWEKGKG